MAHKSHKSKFSIEIALLGTIIGSGVCFAAFHGTRILAQHNDVMYVLFRSYFPIYEIPDLFLCVFFFSFSF